MCSAGHDLPLFRLLPRKHECAAEPFVWDGAREDGKEGRTGDLYLSQNCLKMVVFSAY